MEQQDIFVRTMSLSAFKVELECNNIDIVKNPNTNKLFFVTDNGQSGKVSTKFNDIASEEKEVSWCKDANGEEFWMIHKRNTDNVVATL